MFEDEEEKIKELDRLGVIIFKNTITGQVDVIKLTNSLNLSRQYKFSSDNRRRTILGNYLPDTMARNMPKNLVMEATMGNVELIKTMSIINWILKDELLYS